MSLSLAREGYARTQQGEIGEFDLFEGGIETKPARGTHSPITSKINARYGVVAPCSPLASLRAASQQTLRHISRAVAVTAKME